MKFLRTLLLCCLAPGLYAAAAATKTPPQPDVFLITIDTLRADHVHCYGDEHVQTPAMDALAKNGIRFTNAFTPSPITNTSHTSILTGLLPSTHGVTDFAVPLDPSHLTGAQLLRAHGYHTAAFIGAVILDSRSLAPGLDRGFDFYDNFPERPQTKSRWGRLERRGMDVVQRTEAWLTAHPAGPHFVWMHLYDPHDPYEPPLPFSQTYKDNLYDGEIAYADSALSSFIAYLKRRGWYENAVIAVVGDHGEGLGEHHEDTHGIFLYDSTTHVPLILKLPISDPSGKERIPERVVDAQVRTTDILPTVLDLVGASGSGAMDGQSLMPLLVGNERSQRVVFGETDYPLRFGWAPLRSIRADSLKFIEAPRPELYQLAPDAAELQNTYAPWDKNVLRFRTMVAERRAQTPPRQSAASVGQQTIDELQALGYLGQADAGSTTNVPEASLLPDAKDRIEQQNLLHRALLASEEDRIPAARESLEKVLALDPQSLTALRQLGELELRAGQYAQAAQYLKTALEEHPEDAAISLLAGEALEKNRDLKGARRALELSLKLKPSQFPARLLLGRVLMKSGNPAEAGDQFEAALLMQPGSEEATLALVEAKIEQGNFVEALRQLAGLSHSQNPQVFDLQAQALVRMGKPEEAHKAEARAQRLRQSKPKAQTTLPR